VVFVCLGAFLCALGGLGQTQDRKRFSFVLFFFGAYYKAIKEERLLTKHFSNEYSEYKKQVRALIPFIF